MTQPPPKLDSLLERRRFIQRAAAGTTLLVLGGTYALSDALTGAAQAQTRSDGRARLPPGQRALERLKPMGGQPGNTPLSRYKLKIYGEVERPLELSFADLLALSQEDVVADVHCVTGWSLLDARWKGVSLLKLAERVGVREQARHVIFEAAHGYTANVPRREALKPNVFIVHQHNAKPLEQAPGGPVRALIPDLYFWKSAKWLTGVRFVRNDEPGYWETRGYHNHADPWREERYG